MDAYDLTNEELVEKLKSACARAGCSNSGLVIDVMAGSDLEHARYLAGVVLSRLNGKQPPFKSGMTVRVKPGSQAKTERYNAQEINPDSNYTISKVHYSNNDKWLLHFREVENGNYYADNFEVIKNAASQPVSAQ